MEDGASLYIKALVFKNRVSLLKSLVYIVF